ncbi:MAG: hypothetical protein IT349_10780 [Candidatus Eisenbacteria bacterium]|nr:hypothetical protein [Candidatus Eisenbacteria bacterium]MCC7142571.1 hypothetical protein [Candidatus Eisenbacteria bacterium]
MTSISKGSRCALPGLGMVLLLALQSGEVTAATGWTTVYREVSTFGSVVSDEEDPGLFESKAETSDNGGLFHETVTTFLADQGNSVFSTAWQRSDFSGAVFSFDGTFESRGDLSGGGVFAEGFGASLATPHFVLDAPTDVYLYGVAHASGQGIASMRITNGGGGQVFWLSVSADTRELSEVIHLPAGGYTLALQSGGYGREFPKLEQPSNGSLALNVGLGAPTAGIDAPGTWAQVRIVPNPVRERAMLEFGQTLRRGERVTITDVNGRQVSDLGMLREDVIRWEPRGADGTRLAAGVYFLRAGEKSLGRAIVVR